ncbi:MAG: hypothetical protein WDA02_05005 [Saccharofermentanales bacterium]
MNDIELNDYYEKLKQYKSPIITTILLKIWFKGLRYSIIPIFGVMFILGIFYNINPYNIQLTNNIWIITKILMFVWFSLGILVLIAHLIDRLKMRIEAKKIGLTIDEWDFLINYFNIPRNPPI